MFEAGGPLILSRRNLLMLVGGGLAGWRPLHATTTGFWNKTPPGPVLPEEVMRNTRAKYIEAYERLTGEAFSGS